MDLKNLESGMLFAVLFFNLFLAVYLLNPGFTSFVVFSGDEYKLGSSGDFFNKSSIRTDSEKLVVYFNDSFSDSDKNKSLVLSSYNDSKSMFPLINENSTGIGFRPDFVSEISIGDVISFWRFDIDTGKKRLVVHRVVEKSSDDKGVYFITKGDNNPQRDRGKIRFKDIDSVLVGILY